MRVLVLGADGYLGRSTALHLSEPGDEVLVVDNYQKHQIAKKPHTEAALQIPSLPDRLDLFDVLTEHRIRHEIADRDRQQVSGLVRDFAPDTTIHRDEQPASRSSASLTPHSNHQSCGRN